MAEVATQEKHRAQLERVKADADKALGAPAEQPLEPDPPPDRTRRFRSTNFSRMRTTWGAEDQIRMEEIHTLAGRVMQSAFAEAYDIRERLYLTVRQPRLSPDGSVTPGANGRPQWECHPNGSPIEDWSILTDRDRDQFIHEITIHLFGWEQDAVRLWTEAMYAKVLWEQAFSDGYLAEKGRLTIDDRTQMGHGSSADERYFAVFQSSLSRQADALVRSMTRISQVLRDTRR